MICELIFRTYKKKKSIMDEEKDFVETKVSVELLQVETINIQEGQTHLEDLRSNLSVTNSSSPKDEQVQPTDKVKKQEELDSDIDFELDPKPVDDQSKPDNINTADVANLSTGAQPQPAKEENKPSLELEKLDSQPDFECSSEATSEVDRSKSENPVSKSENVGNPLFDNVADVSLSSIKLTKEIKKSQFEPEKPVSNSDFEVILGEKSEDNQSKTEHVSNEMIEIKETQPQPEEADTNAGLMCISDERPVLDQRKSEKNITNEIKESQSEPEAKEVDINPDCECISDTKSEHDQSNLEDVSNLTGVVNASKAKADQLQSTHEVLEAQDHRTDEQDTNPDFECISDTKSEHDPNNLEDFENFSCVAKATSIDYQLRQLREKIKVQHEPKQSDTKLGLDLECISDTKSEHDPYEDIDEYYESISDEEHTAAADVDDISSSEDEHFVDTVPKHKFDELPFVPKAEFSSELLNTVKEEKFDSEENNFNRKPFSSAVQSLSNNDSNSQFVHNADFSLPPPNFNYAANQNVNFQGYNYNQPSYYNTAQQNYEQHQWYANQAGYDPAANYGNQQFYSGSAGYQNYNQAAYQNYYEAYNNQQYNNYQSDLGAQSAPVNQPVTVPIQPPPHSQDPNMQNYQYNPTDQANINVAGNVNTPDSVSLASKGSNTFSTVKKSSNTFNAVNKSSNTFNAVKKSSNTFSAVKGVSGALVSKGDTVVDSVVTSEAQGQSRDNVVLEAETFTRPVSYKPSSGVGSSSPAADWLDENGDPIKGAFDFEAPEDSGNSVDDKSSKVEYVFSVRSSKSAKDTTVAADTDSNTSKTAQISDNKQSVIPNTGLSLSEQIAAERAKVSEKEEPLDEEKKLYEASKNGEEYKAALQAALATTSLAKVTPSTSKLLSENPLVQKDKVNRFKRMQFTNQPIQDQPDLPNSAGTGVLFMKSVQDVALESQAINEILKEVQHGAARAKQYGALAWQKSRAPAVNKTFLHNTLVSTLRKPYKPPSKRGGRATQGLHDRDGSRSSSSSRSSRSYSSDSRSSSGSSRSSYTSNSDTDGSRSRGPPGYEEAWAAYAAQFGFPWMGPDAYGMYYGPDGWPMDPYDPMFYGDPQAWAEYNAFYGPQNFGPGGRSRGFRGRGRDRGRGMDFRGRGREGEFRGRGWGPPGFRGGGRGMEFRGGPPRGFPFPPRGRGMGPRYRSGRDSRSRSRSSSRDSDPDYRGSRYKGSSRNASRAGSRKSRSKSKSPNSASGENRKRGRSRSPSKGGKEERESENDSTDKSKKKKKRKRKKSKKKKGKEKAETADAQSKPGGEGEKSGDTPKEEAYAEKGQNEESKEKSKSKKGKKHSKHRKKEARHKKDKSKEDRPGDDAGDNPDGKDSSKTDPQQNREEEAAKREETRKEDKEQNGSGSEDKQQRKKRRKEREQDAESSSRKDRKRGDREDKRKEENTKRGSSKKPRDKDGESPTSRDQREESPRSEEGTRRQKQDSKGEAIENDLRLKLKAKRQQRLMQDEGKDLGGGEEKDPNRNPSGWDTKDGSESDHRFIGDKEAVGKQSASDEKKVKRKAVKKKKMSDSGDACADGDETEPKRKKVVKKKIVVVRRKVIRDSSGAIVDPASIVREKGEDGGERSTEGAVVREESVDGPETTSGKRKRIIKRTIIVKRKKKKGNAGPEDALEASGSAAEPKIDSS